MLLSTQGAFRRTTTAAGRGFRGGNNGSVGELGLVLRQGRQVVPGRNHSLTDFTTRRALSVNAIHWNENNSNSPSNGKPKDTTGPKLSIADNSGSSSSQSSSSSSTSPLSSSSSPSTTPKAAAVPVITTSAESDRELALKAILDSAAAEQRKIEQEIRKAAEAKAAKEAAEAAAAARVRAEKLATEEAKAKEEAARKRKISGGSQGSTINATSGPSSPQSAQVSEAHTTGSGQLKGAAPSSRVVSSSTSGSLKQPENSRLVSAASPPTGASKSAEATLNNADDEASEPFKARLLPYKRSIESSTEYLRSAIPDSLRQLSESVKRKDYKETVAQLAEHLNIMTGYTSIEALKHKVITHGDNLDAARIKLLQTKKAYEDAIALRSNTQKAINDLLQRKHLWSPNDVIQFTDLYRSEHANEQSEQAAKIEYKETESDVEEKSRKLTRVIMERYHEEQVWSDKIRAASTYGTWGLIGMNVMAFLLVQAFVEPRRRRKQVERYEELVAKLTEEGILPGSTGIIGQGTGNNNIETGSSEVTTAVVGSGLGATDDIVGKLMTAMQRQEDRLRHMEALLVQQGSSTEWPNDGIDKSNKVIDQERTVALGDEGQLVSMDLDTAEALAWNGLDEMTKEQLAEHWSASSSSNIASLSIEPIDGTKQNEDLIVVRRRDAILGGLGGVVLGGLLTCIVFAVGKQ